MLKLNRNSKISSCLCVIISMALVSIIPMTVHADIVDKIYCGSSFEIDNSSTTPVFYNDVPSYQAGNGGVDGLNAKQILCYKFDVGNIIKEDIKSVKLKIRIRKIYPAGILTVKSITDGWVDSMDNDNITSTPAFTLSNESVTETFTTTTSDGTITLTDIDITTFVEAAKLAEKRTVQLHLTYSAGAGAGNGLRICSMVQPTQSYRPSITVTTEDHIPTFNTNITDTKYMDNYLYVMKDRTTNTTTTIGKDEIFAGKSTSEYITINSNTVDPNNPCDFYFRSDVTSSIVNVVTKATLNLNIVKANRSGTLTVFKLKDDWINDTDLTPTDVDALQIDASKYKSLVLDPGFSGMVSIDVTDLITVGGVTKLYFKYMSNNADNSDGLRLSYTDGLRPNIQLSKTTSISHLSTGLQSVIGTTVLQKGSVDTPQSLLPILALYNTETNTLEKVVVGTTTNLTGVITPLSLTMDVSDVQLNAHHEVCFYLWDGLTEINPIGRMGSISFAN